MLAKLSLNVCLAALILSSSASLSTAQTAMNNGPGGPILVVTSSANPFSRYYAEILRNEGMNYFAVSDISSVSSSTLSAYDVVIVGDLPLTAAQAQMFGDWVRAGGNLIAMHPDKQLAALLGLNDANATLADSYLLGNSLSGPAVGIVNKPIQYHGPADLYTVTLGTFTVATLYKDISTPLTYPAVTLRAISGGGNAAAFTYDLARSVIYTRQGNPAWSGQDRDGVRPIRSHDLFYGASATDPKPDWNNLKNAAIPIADEQQRLLVNLIGVMNQNRKPLPRFWYLPFQKKAAVIMTQDDHQSGALQRFQLLQTLSPPGCSVANWECVRGSSYVFPGTLLTAASAQQYTALGFEVGVHVNNGCVDYTYSSLDTAYTSMFNAFATQFTGVPNPSSQRTHCTAWSDYASQAQIEYAHGVRLDTTYYYYPAGAWSSHPGFFTGSGFPMRFAGLDGSMIDVFQAVTQIPDESLQLEPDTINAILDNAVGPNGYYAVVTVNAHDGSDDFATLMVSAARNHSVPVVSGRQMLQWLDARNSSAFGGFTWNGRALGFTVSAPGAANGLTGMVPAAAGGAALTSVSWNGAPVSFTTQTIKGISFAFFPAQPGAYVATYTPVNLTSSAVMVTGDSLTQGAWKGVYGAEGANVAGDTSNLSWASVPSTAPSYIWNSSPTDVRALQKNSSLGRIAATWYASTSFTVDINPPDTNKHLLSAYLLDWDNQSRSERVEVLDAGTGMVLATSIASNFAGGLYLSWNVSGHVQLRFTNLSGPNAVLSGLFSGGSAAPALPPPDTLPPTVQVTAPSSGQILAGPVTVSANASDNVGVTGVQFQLDGTNLGTNFTAPPYTLVWNTASAANGAHTIAAIARDAAGNQSSSSLGITVSNAPPPPTQTFLKTDLTTLGSWKGVYGSNGYSIAGDGKALPQYALTSFDSGSVYVWNASTADPRALQSALYATRLASCWYSFGPFSLDVNLTDNKAHNIALYFIDWDGQNRIQTVDLLDGTTGNVLDSHVLSNFKNGAYIVWNVSGHVKIRVTRTSGPNGVLSAMFVD